MSYYVRAAFVCGVCLEKLHGTKKDGFLPESHRIGSMCFQVICDFIIRQRNTSFRQMPGDFARAVAEGVLLADKDSAIYESMKERYIELKVFLTVSGINLSELDRIRE